MLLYVPDTIGPISGLPLDERAFQFVLSFHHACLDGWSLAALITELFADYARLINRAI